MFINNFIFLEERTKPHEGRKKPAHARKPSKAIFLVFGAKTIYRRTQNQLKGTKEPTTRERPEEAKVKEKSRMERDKAVQCKRDQAKNAA